MIALLWLSAFCCYETFWGIDFTGTQNQTLISFESYSESLYFLGFQIFFLILISTSHDISVCYSEIAVLLHFENLV